MITYECPSSCTKPFPHGVYQVRGLRSVTAEDILLIIMSPLIPGFFLHQQRAAVGRSFQKHACVFSVFSINHWDTEVSLLRAEDVYAHGVSGTPLFLQTSQGHLIPDPPNPLQKRSVDVRITRETVLSFFCWASGTRWTAKTIVPDLIALAYEFRDANWLKQTGFFTFSKRLSVCYTPVHSKTKSSFSKTSIVTLVDSGFVLKDFIICVTSVF